MVTLKKIKEGDIVGRISYKKDVLFNVVRIINDKTIILKGITTRVEADAEIDDLEIISPKEVTERLRFFNDELYSRITKEESNVKRFLGFNIGKRYRLNNSGRILHLDGDRKYSEKSLKYYRGLGLNAIVRNIAENRQAMVVKQLVERYQPDILVITGHDGMIKRKVGYQDIYNYRNSRHFVKTVQEARSTKSSNELVIFAGACQSFYEAIITAGANFASSPARILIDFVDPLVVAEKIATTDAGRFVTINDFEKELRDGQRGVSGIGAMGKMKKM